MSRLTALWGAPNHAFHPARAAQNADPVDRGGSTAETDHEGRRTARIVRVICLHGQEAAKRRMEIRLRQNGEITGPFTMEQLAKLWDEGKVGANDEYHYEGMADFLPVSQFVPPE